MLLKLLKKIDIVIYFILHFSYMLLKLFKKIDIVYTLHNIHKRRNFNFVNDHNQAWLQNV